MGRRKKKQFINKKEAYTYSLVTDGGGIAVPDTEYGSKATRVDGKLDRVLPVTGPRPDWDPDVVEALDNAEMSDSGEQLELEDDFVLLANGSESDGPVAVSSKQHSDAGSGNGGTGSEWWVDRMGDSVRRPEASLAARGGGGDDEGDDECSSGGSLLTDDSEEDKMERRTAQFTQYTMTSSVLPRSEALTLLDDRFEQFMVQYNDDQLGAGDDEGVDMVGGTSGDRHHMAEYDEMLLETALKDFKKNFSITTHINGNESDDNEEEEEEKLGGGTRRSTEVQESSGERTSSTGDNEDRSGDSSDEDGDKEPVDRVEVSCKSQWDCESILSTYSTLYNHPTKIVEPPRSTSMGKVKLSRKTGIPLGAIPGLTPKENIPKKIPISRPKDESKDEKKLRKSLQKSERKQRRAEKKATKLAFKSEEIRQTSTMMGVAHTRPGCVL